MKPAWQPQPRPAAPSHPGVNSGPNGRPPGQATVPRPNASMIATTEKQAKPLDNGVTSAPETYRFSQPSPVFPEVVTGRHAYNPITGEWLIPRG